jgi:hypothetical protein
VDRRGAGGREGTEGGDGKGAPPSGGRELACLAKGRDQLAADLVLVVPAAGVDRVEWAKQLVGNAVRSPYTRQAYLYALQQFFVWAAGRAVSRKSERNSGCKY